MIRSLTVAMLLASSVPAVAAPAPAVAPSPAHASVHRFKIGAFDAMTFYDGNNLVANDGKVLGVDEGPAKVAAVLTDAGVPSDKLRLDINVLVVRAGKRVVMFDTGNGPKRNGKLIDSLALGGVSPGEVTDVVITHGHGDHVNGLLDAAGKSAFPNARIHLTVAERASLKPDSPIAAVAAQVVTFAAGAAIAPGVTAVDLPGHTAGHSGYLVTSGRAKLLVIGDAAHHYIVSTRQPEFTIAFDMNPAVAEPTRRALFERAVRERLTLYAPHFPYPGVGTIRREGDGFAWVPTK